MPAVVMNVLVVVRQTVSEVFAEFTRRLRLAGEAEERSFSLVKALRDHG